MKQFLTTVFCLLVISISAQEKNFKEFYKSHKKEAAVSLNLPGFVAGWFIEDSSDKEIDELIGKAKNYKVMVFDKNAATVQKDFKKFVKQNNLKTLVRAKDGKDRVAVYFKETGNLIKEIIVNVSGKDDESVLLGLKTNLTKDELNKIVSSAKKS